MTTATKKTKKKNLIPATVEELRRSGFKVRVYHGRVFWSDTRSNGCVVTSKREMEAESHNFDYRLLCHGGYTSVDVTTPDGVELHGKYSFGNRQFNRKIGLRAAIGRAFTGRKRSRKSI